jgi:Leucine-rich repeat (LRR) protein
MLYYIVLLSISSLKGLRPELRLTTPDGAIFEGTDPISLAIGVNILSTVLDWKLPPLGQRYMEACTQMKTAVDQELHHIMDLCQATQHLSLADQNLTANLSKPIFKALNHQTNLMFLDLSNNSLQNDGLKSLVPALPTLQQLKSLNLSNNLITAAGLEHLASIFDSTSSASEVLVNLNELELAHNPLYNESVKSLARICSNLPQLRKLNLSTCELETFYDFDLNFGGLSDLNVSFNQLSVEAVRKLLPKLNTCILVRLNLNFCGPKMTELGKHFAATFDSGTGSCLQALHLANLNLTDSDLWEIVCAIKKCDGLEELHLLQNPLTTVSLKYLFNKLPMLEALHLDGCNRLLRTLDSATFLQEHGEPAGNGQYPKMVTVSMLSTGQERLEQINSLEAVWKQCWGEKAKIEVRHGKIKLYVEKNL